MQRIVLSEINWAGSSQSTADEWIEIANTGAGRVDISGWQLEGAGSSGSVLMLPENAILEPRSTYLIANYQLSDPKTSLAIAASYATSSVSIPNSGLHIILKNASGEIMDSYIDSGIPDYGSSTTFASIERDLTTYAWSSSTASKNLHNAAQMGTPGYALFLVAETTSTSDPDLIATVVEEDTEATLEGEASEQSQEESSDESLVIDEVSEVITELSSEEMLLEDALSTEEAAVEEAEDESVLLEKDKDVFDDETAEDEDITLIELIPDSLEEETLQTEENVSNLDAVDEVHTETSSQQEIVTPIVVTTALPAQTTNESSSDTTSSSSTTNQTEEAKDTETTAIDMHYDPTALIITEFVSSPSDGKEWIELFNTSEEEVGLEGWRVADRSGKETLLSGSIEKGKYILIENPSGKLNNDGDDIVFMGPDEQIIFLLTYGSDEFAAPKKDLSAGLCDGAWIVGLTPTPTAANDCPVTTSESSTSSYESTTSATQNNVDDADQGTTVTHATVDSTNDVTATTDATAATTHVETATSVEKSESTNAKTAKDTTTQTSSTKKTATIKKTTSKAAVATYQVIDISDLDSLKTGTLVEVSGIIIAEPGIFGKRLAYLEGMQLYMHTADWPTLPEGTEVTIRGTWDTSSDTRRIKIKSSSDIDVGETLSLPPVSYDATNLAQAPTLSLITVSGTVKERSKNGFILALNDSITLSVVDTAKLGLTHLVAANDTLTITGMVDTKDGNMILVPRTKDDLVFTEKEETSSATTTDSIITPSSESSVPIVGGGLLVSSAGALGYWFIRSRKLIPLAH